MAATNVIEDIEKVPSELESALDAAPDDAPLKVYS